MRKVWMVVAAAALLAACGDDNGTTTKASAPVSLPGTVADHGTKDIGSAKEIELEVDDEYFSPTFIQAAPGTTVTVALENEGKMNHTFTIDGAGIDQNLAPDAKATVDVTMPSSGSLAFYCRFHKASGMQGAFVVSGAGASTATTTAPASSGAAGGGGYGY
jgi:plastocyanin